MLIGVAIFVGLLWLPQTEGRAADLDLISIYTDPFILYIYIASIPFFMGLFQAIRLLGYIEKNKIFSQVAIEAMQNIKYRALSTICFIIGAEAFITLSSEEDITGILALGAYLVLLSSVVVATADVFQKVLLSNWSIGEKEKLVL